MSFVVTTENAPFIIQAFKTNPANAKGIIRGAYDISDSDFNQILVDYNFNGFQHLIPQKKTGKILHNGAPFASSKRVLCGERRKANQLPAQRVDGGRKGGCPKTGKHRISRTDEHIYLNQ